VLAVWYAVARRPGRVPIALLPGLTAGRRGYGAAMTETPEPIQDQPDRATTVGETGGLPGRNAAPQASQISADEMADTVSGAGPGPAGGTAAGEGETSTASND